MIPETNGPLSRRTLLGMLFASSVAAAATYVTTRRHGIATKTVSFPEPPATIDALTPEQRARIARASFYDTEVEPNIFATDLLNREAGDRALIRLQKNFDTYHAGVKTFVKDLTSVSTRLGIVRRLPGQWWASDERINEYIREKFEKYLFSEQRLMDDIAGVFNAFQSDVDANQRRMLVDIRAALSSADLPEVKLATYNDFFDAIANKLQNYSSDSATSSVYNAITVFIVSEAGGQIARTLILGLLARFGTSAAVSTVAATGATAGSATIGAGGGSVGGPVGAVVGFGVGLAVGLVIDWWMTEKFEAEMSSEMAAYLDSLEASILYGGNQNQTDEGLVGAMPVVCDRLLDAYRERFYKQIVIGE